MRSILVCGYLRENNLESSKVKGQKGILEFLENIYRFYGNFTIKTTPMTFCGDVITFNLLQNGQRIGMFNRYFP